MGNVARGGCGSGGYFCAIEQIAWMLKMFVSAANSGSAALPAVAAVSHRRHSWSMPTRRPAETTPDLFSAPLTVAAAGPSAGPKGGPDSLGSQRHFLPEDLAGALKRLDDVEINELLAAVTTEAERHGRYGRPARRKRSQ